MDVKKELLISKGLIEELNKNYKVFKEEFTAFMEGRPCDKKVVVGHVDLIARTAKKMTDRNMMLMLEVDDLLDKAKEYHDKGWKRNWIIGGVLAILYIGMTIVNLILK
jgi:hypothetical protein